VVTYEISHRNNFEIISVYFISHLTTDGIIVPYPVWGHKGWK